MRTKALTSLVATALLLTACAESPKTGNAAPSTTTAATPTTAAPTTAVPATSPATTLLGPLGYGAVTLGMTKEQALATGLLTPFDSGDGCARAEVKGAPAGGWVMLSPKRGVAAIDAWDTLATTEGVHIGTPAAEARRAYPNWTIVDGTLTAGRHFAKVPGNDAAVFRIGTRDDKVTEVTLQLANQDCYE